MRQLKSSSSSVALIPINDEGFSFLETENASLREELETLKRVRPASTSRGRTRAGRSSIEETRTQQALENQASELKAKNQALVEMS